MFKNIIRGCLFLIFFCFSLLTFSQKNGQFLTTKSKKAEKAFNKAKSFYYENNYFEAEKFLQKALEIDTNFIEAYLLLGDLLADKNDKTGAIEAYESVIEIDPEYSSIVYYILAGFEFSAEKYIDSRKHFSDFILFTDIDSIQKKFAQDYIEICDFVIEARANPVPFKPVNLGDSINSSFDEYINAITVDEQLMLFTVKEIVPDETNITKQRLEEEFYLSEKQDGIWGKAVKMGYPLNSSGNQGAICLSPDGKKIFFTACNRFDGYGSCDIYFSEKTNDKWSEPINLGQTVNSASWDSQPSISSDGKTLYFASTRKDGYGSSDIWKTGLLPSGNWSEPVNLGEQINTKKAEMSPFIHADNSSLYFSSKGHPGMGGADLFLSKFDINEQKWSQPNNLGFPINTIADEINIIVDASGKKAYLSSDKSSGMGKQDIYSFELYKDIRPSKVTYLKGKVYDSISKKTLSADFELIDLESNEVLIKSVSDKSNGSFLICLPVNINYALNVSKEGYLFYSENFSLNNENSHTEPFLMNIALQPIQRGNSVILRNVFFDTDKYELKPESEVELLKLISFLQNNPKIKIEIGGHTDNIGSEEYNLNLSETRAKAVYEFLIKNGIEKSRLTFQAYGFSKPIDNNETPEGRANNRRTEFKVLEI